MIKSFSPAVTPENRYGAEAHYLRANGRRLKLWLCGLLLALVPQAWAADPIATTRPADARHWELLAHGSEDHLWYAFTTPAGSNAPHSVVRERELQQPEWRDLNDFPARLLAVGDLRKQLVAALDDGEWKRILPDQLSSGPPLPGRGEILSVVGEEGTLWAIGFAEGARPEVVGAPEVRSTTRPTTRTSGPTTRPEQLQLYKLGPENWAHVAALPVDVRTARSEEISMILVKGTPIIAYKESVNLARVLRFSSESKSWVAIGTIKPSFALRKLKLMTARGKLIGWAVGETGVGSFSFPPDVESEATWREQALAVPANLKVMDVSVAAAMDELHLFVINVGDEQFYEQKYDLAGRQATAAAVEKLAAPSRPGELSGMDMINWGLLGLLMIVTLAAANKGGPVLVVQFNKVELALAPFSLRLAAGLIDLWPIYLGYALIAFHPRSGLKPSQFYSDQFNQIVGAAALGVYFLHTLLGELFVGRSVGKMFVGLSVTGLDGKRAPIGAIILRNLMRLIEVPGMGGVPLLSVLFNPLRQRLGDFAAGTVVVAKMPPKDQRETVEVIDE